MDNTKKAHKRTQRALCQEIVKFFPATATPSKLVPLRQHMVELTSGSSSGLFERHLKQATEACEAMQESWIAAEGFDNVVQVLKSVRSHLGMDVAFVSEFVGENRVFRYLDTGSTVLPFHQGDVSLLRDSYCVRVVDGRLPQLMTNAHEVPEAASLEVTRSLPVGAHLSVPLRLADGSLYGTFCCFSHEGNASLNQQKVP